MKRRLLILGVFLLLGAVVNVAVAWGFAAWGKVLLYEGAASEVRPATWPRAVPESWPAAVNRWDYSALGCRMMDVGSERGNLGICGQMFYCYGWPSMSLEFEQQMDQRGGTDNRRFLAAWPIPKQLRDGDRHRVQLHPLRLNWLCFMIDTTFYGALLWLPMRGATALRRKRRVKRGLCLVCGYPIGSSPVCTECGKPVRPRSDSPSFAGRGSGGG